MAASTPIVGKRTPPRRRAVVVPVPPAPPSLPRPPEGKLNVTPRTYDTCQLPLDSGQVVSSSPAVHAPMASMDSASVATGTTVRPSGT